MIGKNLKGSTPELSDLTADDTALLDSAGTLFGGGGRMSLSSVEFFTDLVGRVAELGFTDAITHWPRPEAPYAADEER